jgi:hypothetical protein
MITKSITQQLEALGILTFKIQDFLSIPVMRIFQGVALGVLSTWNFFAIIELQNQTILDHQVDVTLWPFKLLFCITGWVALTMISQGIMDDMNNEK